MKTVSFQAVSILPSGTSANHRFRSLIDRSLATLGSRAFMSSVTPIELNEAVLIYINKASPTIE